ncbi:hypothetical protein V8C35DRAFT_285741 [Trichoderma chlorosporum]
MQIGASRKWPRGSRMCEAIGIIILALLSLFQRAQTRPRVPHSPQGVGRASTQKQSRRRSILGPQLCLCVTKPPLPGQAMQSSDEEITKPARLGE